MKVVVIIVIVILALFILGFLGVLYFASKGPKLADFEHLLNPRITELPDQSVIEVVAKGDPNETGGEAIGLLFKTYFKIKGAPKGKPMQAPRARWAIDSTLSKSEWVGKFAIPIPKNIAELPQIRAKSTLPAEIAIWEYGEVA